MLTRFPTRSLHGLTLLLMQISDPYLYRPSFWDVKSYREEPEQLTEEGNLILQTLEKRGLLPTDDRFEEQVWKAKQTKTGQGRINNVLYKPLSIRAQTQLSAGIPKVRDIWSVADYFHGYRAVFVRFNAFDQVPDYRPLFVLITDRKHRFLKDTETGIVHHLVPVQLILPFCPIYGGIAFSPFTFQTPLFQKHCYAIIDDDIYVPRELLQRRILHMNRLTLKKIRGYGSIYITVPDDQKLWDAYRYYDQQKHHLVRARYELIAPECRELTSA